MFKVHTEMEISWINIEFFKGIIYSCVCLVYHVIFIFPFANVVYQIDLFENIEPSLHPWDKSPLFMVYYLVYVLLNLFCYHFVEVQYSSEILACNFSFCSVFVLFCYQGDGDLLEWLWECPFLFDFLEQFEDSY